MEPTEPTDYQPIERTRPVINPYDYTEIPPPPPKRRRNVSKLVWIALVSSVLVFCSSAVFYWSYTYHVNTTKPTPIVVVVTPTPKPPTPTPTPTTAPTPAHALAPVPTPIVIVVTPTTQPTASTPFVQAADLYSEFVNAGIATTYGGIDTKWGCCTYYPEGGAVYWTDVNSGYLVEIATFSSSGEAVTDGDQAASHYPKYTYDDLWGCLLIYDKRISLVQMSPYMQIAQNSCVPAD